MFVYELHRDLKVVLLGTSNVGKTSLIKRYMTDEFGDNSIPVSNHS